MVDKDSLGEKLRDKEKAEEDRYFARRDRELLERLRGALAEGGDAAQPAQAPIRCPGCEAALHELRRGEISVRSCPTCHGLWLERATVEAIAAKDPHGWLARFATAAADPISDRR